MNVQYPIHDILKKNINTIPNNVKINICIFRINKEGLNPFLEFLLYKYTKKYNDILTFPFTRKNIIKAKKYATTICKNTLLGYLKYLDQYYIFCEVKEPNYNNKLLKRNNNYWWCILDEICNQKKILNFPIHKCVSSIFIKYPKLIYLYKKQNEPYEIPTVAYQGMYYDLIPIIATLGSKNMIYNSHGPYFYFYSYEKAPKNAGWRQNKSHHQSKIDKHNRFDKGGIIRYALFLGNIKVCNEIKDQNWTTSYDSVYNNHYKFGKFFLSEYEYIVKHFQQQMPISFHILNKSSLDTYWKETGNYYIE